MMTSTHRAARNRARVLTVFTASALVATLAVDPFSLGSVAPVFANGTGTLSIVDRDEAFADFVAERNADDPIDAADLQSTAPSAPESVPLVEPPAPTPVESDEELIVLSGSEPSGALAAAVTSTQNTPPPSGPVEAVVGGLDITVEALEGEASPDAVLVSTASEAEAIAAGIDGVLLDVTDASTTAVGNAEVTLTVEYDTFAGIGGAEWASRLQFVWIPDCPETTDDCGPQVLPTVNDQAEQTVTAVVPVAEGDTAATAGLASSANLIQASAAATGGSLAITAGPSGSQGNWAATNLSAASTWGNSGNTGSFTWSMPLRVPSVPAGPAPELGISYSSAASDGRLPSTNNQTGPIGEGFDLPMAYIERTYTPCMDDEGSGANNNNRPSGDLCWGTQNATMSFNGGASDLVRQGTSNVWHSKFADGTKIEHLTGGVNNGGERDEYWKVTTTDGTQYFFGRGAVPSGPTGLNSAWAVPVFGNNPGEPCHASAFKDSRCQQVYRWNLDHVVDPQGNTMTYRYQTEANHYLFDVWGSGARERANQTMTAQYTAGGQLTSIEYGTTVTTGPDDKAPAVVEFTYGTRCLIDLANPDSFCANGTSTSNQHWPDTPVDLICTSSTSEKCSFSPTFFTTKRLTAITTKTFDGTDHVNVSTWSFAHTYVPQGAGSSLEYALNPMLVLEGITETALGGNSIDADDIVRPSIDFGYVFLQNRVQDAPDGYLPMFRPRLNSLLTETGARISVTYRTDCTGGDNPIPSSNPSTNAGTTVLCFPVKWFPDGAQGALTEYFHKYVVQAIEEIGTGTLPNGESLVTGSQRVVTTFEYEGDAEWRKPTGPMVDADTATFSDFRGYSSVLTTVGSGDEARSTRTQYFQGLGATTTLTTGPAPHQVTASDHPRFQGQVFAATELNGAVPISQVVTVPGDPVTVAGTGNHQATRIPSTTTYAFTFDAAGDVEFRTKTVTESNSFGQVTSVSDDGDLTTTTDDICTRVTYAHEGSTTQAQSFADKHLVSLVSSTTVKAASCVDDAAQAADVISRDTVEYNSAGQLLKTFRINPAGAGPDQLVKEVLAYDDRGRPTRVKDAAGVESTMTYTHSAGGLLASITSTIEDGVAANVDISTTTTFNPLTGMVVETVDASGLRTVGQYDSLGRLTSVRYPQHATTAEPSVEYEYSVSKTGLNSVVTRTLAADGVSQHVSATHYDGLLRPFQYQAEGRNAGVSGNADANARGQLVATLIYDSAGRLASQTSAEYVQGIPGTPVVLPTWTTKTTIEYDQAGRPVAEVFWGGSPSEPSNELWRNSTHYDGARTLQIPPMGGTPQMAIMDARGRTVELRQYIRDADTHSLYDTAAEILHPDTGLSFHSTTYTFDRAGQMVQMADTEDNVWEYDFDLAGRLVSATDPDGGTTTTTYDAANRVQTRTNGNGEVLAYQYDRLGRTIAIRDGGPAGPVRAAWEFDTALLPNGNPAIGQLASATRFVGASADEYVTAIDTYDEAYRPLATTFTLPNTDLFSAALASREFTTTYSYTADGQVANLTHPAIVNGESATVLGAEMVSTQFDTASQPGSMGGGFGWGIYVANSSFAGDGRLVAMDLGNTYAARVGYDYEEHTKRLSAISLDRETFGTAFDLRHSYDDAGNVLSIRDAAGTTAATRDTQCFGYDGLQRLTLAWTAAADECTLSQGSITPTAVGGVAPYWTEYTYDPLGNRTTMVERGLGGNPTVTTTYQHGQNGAGPHQLTSMTESVAQGDSTTTTFAYDDAGNRISSTVGGVTQGFQWDVEGELTSAGGEIYTYDASGNRILRESEAGLTVYLPGGQELLITGAGETAEVSATRYYSFAGRMVAMRTAGGLSGVTSFVADHQGSLIAAVPNTTWTSNSVQRIYTDPFGGTRTGSGNLPGDRGFLGAVEDATGLTLLGARYYDPQVGSFISVDPLLSPGVPAQFNAYVYSANNPVTWSDPSGLFWGNLWSGIQSAAQKIGNAVSSAWNATVSFVDQYKAEIAGVVVGLAVGIGCTVATAGAGVVACAIAGGAAGAAVTNVIKQAESGKPFDVGSFLFDTAVGGALGAVGGAAGPLLSSAIRSITTSGAGAAAVNAVRTGLQNTLNRMPSFRPAPAPVRPPVAPGGGAARPAGSPSNNGASCAIGNSLAPATLVLMADGSTEPIEKIDLGDEVWAADPETGEAGARPVTALIEGEGVKDLVTVSTASGSVVATAGHPFWSVSDAAWARAGDLSVGDAVLQADGATSVITQVAEVSRPAVVRNLTVAGLHTYFVVVGDAPTLVHNSSCSGGQIPFGPAPQKVANTLDRVDSVGAPFPNTAGGRVWRNDRSQLPSRTSDGSDVTYREWDFDPRVPGLPRNAERLVTGSDGSAYYTVDHYDSFILIRGATQ